MKTFKKIKITNHFLIDILLTGKNPGAIGPPGIPSFGGSCPKGLGAAAF
jgi:hypothetical protein